MKVETRQTTKHLLAVAIPFLSLSWPTLLSADLWQWEETPTDITAAFHQVSVLDPEFAVAVAGDQTVLRWNGEQWETFPGTELPWGEDHHLQSVAVINPHTLWVGSYGGERSVTRRLARWQDGRWGRWVRGQESEEGNHRVITLWTDKEMMVVAGRSRGGGITIHQGGHELEGWVDGAMNDGKAVDAWVSVIDGTSRDNLYALASGRLLHSSDGSAQFWEVVGELPAEGVNDLAVAGPNFVWLVGEGGAVWSWDGNSFQEWTTPTGDALNAVYALDAERAWAVGDNARILEFDGQSWQLADAWTDLATNWRSIDGNGEDFVMVTGTRGAAMMGRPGGN